MINSKILLFVVVWDAAGWQNMDTACVAAAAFPGPGAQLLSRHHAVGGTGRFTQTAAVCQDQLFPDKPSFSCLKLKYIFCKKVQQMIAP